MEVLTLLTKKKAFENILLGSVKEERREITPATQKKYVVITPTEVTIRMYDAIRYLDGNKKDAPEVLVKINATELDYEPDEEGFIQLEEDESGNLHIIEANMVYTLGEILEKKNIE